MAGFDDLIKRARQGHARSQDKAARNQLTISDVFKGNTYKRVNVTYRHWEKLIYPEDPELEAICNLWKKPNFEVVKVFLEYIVEVSKGKVGKTISKSRIQAHLHHIRCLVRRLSNSDFTMGEWASILTHVSHPPETFIVSTAVKEKPLCTPDVVIDILAFLWLEDEHQFKNASCRFRMQISFSILIMLYCGLRPGEFVESTWHAGSNEGLKYRDFELHAVRKGQDIKWLIALTLRLRKAKRHDEGSTTIFLLRATPDHPWLCPVAQFLGLALADGALDHIKSPEDLSRVSIGQNRENIVFKANSQWANVPVLRQSLKSGATSATKVMTAEGLRDHLRRLGHRAGYRQDFSAYAVRRAHGNALDRVASSAERRMRMSHRDDAVYDSAYISKISAVDTQGIMLNAHQDTELFEQTRSMASSRDTCTTQLWRSKLSKRKALHPHNGLGLIASQRRIVQKRRLREAREEYEREAVKTALSAALPPTASTTHIAPELQCGDETDGRAEITSGYLSTSEEEDTLGESVLPPGADSRMFRLALQRQPSPLLRSALRYDPARRGVCTLWSKIPDYSTAIRMFVNAARQDILVGRYPDTMLTEEGCCGDCNKVVMKPGQQCGREGNYHLLFCALRRGCPGDDPNWRAGKQRADFNRWRLRRCIWGSCGSALPNQSSAVEHVTDHTRDEVRCYWSGCGQYLGNQERLADHLLKCHKVYTLTTVPSERNFCFICRKYIEDYVDWTRHCDKHLDRLDSFQGCGVITYANVVVRPGYCPFCAADKRLSSQLRFHQYFKGFHHYDHIWNRHVRHGERYPMSCPVGHCGDSLTCSADMMAHMSAEHGVFKEVQQMGVDKDSGGDSAVHAAGQNEAQGM